MVGIVVTCVIILFFVRFAFYLSYSENERLALKIKRIEKGNLIAKVFGFLTKFEKVFFVVTDVDSSSNFCLKYIIDEKTCSPVDYYYIKFKNKSLKGFLKAPAHIRMLQNEAVNIDNYVNSIIDFSLFKAYITEKNIIDKDSIIETYVHFLKQDQMLSIDRTRQKQYQLNYDINVLQLPYEMAVESVDRNWKMKQTNILTYKRIKSAEDLYYVNSVYDDYYKKIEEIDIEFQNRIDWFWKWGLLSIGCQMNGSELVSVVVNVLYSSETAWVDFLALDVEMAEKEDAGKLIKFLTPCPNGKLVVIYDPSGMTYCKKGENVKKTYYPNVERMPATARVYLSLTSDFPEYLKPD